MINLQEAQNKTLRWSRGEEVLWTEYPIRTNKHFYEVSCSRCGEVIQAPYRIIRIKLCGDCIKTKSKK